MKKIDINSTEPINRVAEIDEVFAALEKRGGYITLDEDLRIRKRISNRAHLAYWIGYVKNKLVYTKRKIVKHIPEARNSIIGKHSSKMSSSPIVIKKETNVFLKRSLIIDSYSDICKEDSTLRPYQQKAKKEIFESWDEVDNVMFQMPTGTGKTRLFTSIIKDINDYSIQRREPVKILIIAHRKELIRQIGKSLKRYCVPNNMMDEGNERDYRFPVVVASIQTITHPKNLRDAEKLNVRFVIIDEAHHALAATYKKLWDMYPDSKKLGVTATPWRMNHQSFTDLFDKLVLSMPIKDFIKQGYLAPYKYFSLRSDSDILNTIDDIELDKFGEYKESSLEEKMDIGKIRAQLLQSYLALAEGKKGIIYAINIVHARHICKEYQEAGYTAVSIDSRTPAAERDDLVEKFRRGKIDIIVNVDIFSEGFDCPDIEFIQLARPTRSLVKYLQQVGRGLRPTENKEHCIILDNVGMYSRFGLPDARRHWKYHFLGHDVDEEVPKRSLSKGTGRTRDVDMSEGTEDMELIQDVSEEDRLIEKDTEEIETPVDDENDNQSETDDLFYDNNGVSYKPGHEILVSYPNSNHYDLIEIPSFITSIKSRAFEKNSVSEIVIHDEILELGDLLFMGCQNLKTITIKKETPNDILIDKNTFKAFFIENCVLRVPFDSIARYKGDERFNGFKYITAIEGSRCLMYDDNGTEVVSCDEDGCETLQIPEGVTSIKDEAFEGNEAIVSVSFPESLEIIGDSAFSGCRGITKITLNDGLEDIGYDAFRGTKLTGIEIPSNVNSIGASAFNCEIQVTSLNTDLYSLDGVLLDFLETKLIIYPSNKRAKHYDVPDDILEIGYFAFEDSCLQSISLPESIKTLGTNIFNGCDDLNELTINVENPNEIEIHKDCFNGFNKSQCKLIVPHGCKDKYSAHGMFKDFQTIEEMNTEDDEKINPQIGYTKTIDENEIEHVYVGIPSADPYVEIECEDETLDDKEVSTARVPIDIKKLDYIFEKKATSCKYFWFMAIISLAKDKKSLTIPYRDIVIRMATLAWPIVFEYEIDLGKSDMISKYLNDILKQSTLIKNLSSKVVEAYLSVYYDSDGIGEILEPLLKNVPYRFLSPWIKYTTDEEVVEKSNSADYACLYALQDNGVVLNEEWWEYIKKNYTKICNSTERSFVTYLEPKNNHQKLAKFMSKGWNFQ